jgi:hypothetical protein
VLIHLGHQIFVGVANVRFEVRIRCIINIANMYMFALLAKLNQLVF